MSSRDVSEQIAKYGCPYYYNSTAGSLQNRSTGSPSGSCLAFTQDKRAPSRAPHVRRRAFAVS